MITRTSVDLEFFQDASYDDVRKTLKRLAEFDFANPKSLDEHDTNLMLLMLEACKAHPSAWNSYFTDVQYLLMFPRRRSEVARSILVGGRDRESVLQVFQTLVGAAFLRSKMMSR